MQVRRKLQVGRRLRAGLEPTLPNSFGARSAQLRAHPHASASARMQAPATRQLRTLGADLKHGARLQ